MKCNLLLTASLIVLAGCNQADMPTAVTTAGSTSAVESTAAPTAEQAASCIQAGYQWQPGDLAITIPYHLRADRIYTNKNNQERRRVVLEFLDGDAEANLASVDKSMTAAGFSARPRRDQPNGNIIVPYAKKGYGSITVVTSVTVGEKPSDPAAKGTIAFDFPSGSTASTAMAID